ncbi:MAG: transglutaminase-like domain-containing protein [Paludibacter sp.]
MKFRYIILAIIISITFVFVFFRNTNNNLKATLSLAGKNKNQLEKVIDYYSDPKDSLKRKAAIFLIENMYIHYGFYGQGVDQYNKVFNIIDTINHKQGEPKSGQMQSILDSFSTHSEKLNYYKKYDCEIMTSEYLINNIELAFQAREELPWSKKVNFNSFCEYILPYRLRNEKLEYWRPKFFTDYYKMAIHYQNTESLTGVYNYIKSNLDYYIRFDLNMERNYPFHQTISDLLKSRIGSCYDISAFKIGAMRAVGIPVSLDFIPNWGTTGAKHAMVHLVIDNLYSKKMTNENSAISTEDLIDVSMVYNEGKKVFSTNELPAGLYVQYNKAIPKVYRSTYSVQAVMKEILDVKDKNEIAPEFNFLNIKDVTKEFLTCSTVSVNLWRKFHKHQISYLCTFNISGWKPIALTKINANGKAVFKEMGRKVIYLPTVLENKEFIPAGLPFYIDSLNNIKLISPQKSKLQEIKLIRKYPLYVTVANYSLKLKGGRFEGSNSPDFTKKKLLYEIDYNPFYMNLKVINCNNRFRYLRYMPPKGSGGNIAEVEFYGIKNRDTLLLGGSIIGDSESAKHERTKAFDKDMNTYYENKVGDGWIGIDLGAGNQQRVTKIRFCPRNDTNCIISGNNYELFYWNNQWISLGQQTADKDYLVYNNIPSGALFWLKCLSGGKEERIFTYENGKQMWW